MSKVTDTSKLPALARFAVVATPGGIVAQEAQGQRELVESTLPASGLFREHQKWEALGVKILDRDGGREDSLFCRVELPAGWKKVPTASPLWTDLVDAAGKVRAHICYKAAFYDRHAHVQLLEEP